ncbi:MAG: sigma-70 family RNA polymerase sigma factor [Saprospiraceae bacterium]|jgi:RNA polymerase sigma factor (sigma-70 family)|nr:sigma-70 family RNA polymerase sigma factor [Saprospiraceae bacterium]MBL0025158.1 sigma-70 family RNA polymerase sigma factor [Saprospiraceae bacterium]
MNDLELWRRLRGGDQKALKEVYDMCSGNLANYAKKFTQDTELIEDAIHDLFVFIWQKKENLNDTDSIIKYLCVSLRREIIRRVSKTLNVTSFENAENNDFEFSLSVEDMIIQNETNESNKLKLKEAFKELSNRQREAIYLKYYEEMSYDQICEVMEINYQSVRNLISKGIIVLKKVIGLVILLISVLIW